MNIVILFGASCTKDETFDDNAQPNTAVTRAVISENIDFVFKDKIMLGNKLDNPYSVRNMKLASTALSKDPSFNMEASQLPVIRTTHYYVKFAPASNDELLTLKRDTTLILYEYPLDYEVLEEGITYHDPFIPDSLPTYQYASIEESRWKNMLDTLTVAYEVLEDLFIPDEDKIVDNKINFIPGDKILIDGELQEREDIFIAKTAVQPETDWAVIETLVSKSMELTDNSEPAVPETRGSSKWRPSGRITAYDNIVNGAIPLEKVRVRARR